MRNKDTGEFELVVGDKQLLSGFFIGVLLLAVVFAMGYVLGRGTPKSASVAPETAAIPATTSAQSPVQSPTTSASAPAPTTADTPVMNPDVAHPDTGTPATEPPPQPTTVPAKEATAPAPPPKVEPAPAPPPAEPAAGTYWQVLAGSQTSADAMTQTLKSQGFPVIKRPGHNNLTLVWVGPYSDKPALTRAKKQLEDAGIANPIKKP